MNLQLCCCFLLSVTTFFSNMKYEVLECIEQIYSKEILDKVLLPIIELWLSSMCYMKSQSGSCSCILSL